MRSVPSRRNEPSAPRRMCSGRLSSSPVCLPSPSNVEAELRGDDDLVADRRERLTDDLLVDERAVHLGGVEEGDAAVDGGADERDALLAGRHGQ